MPKKKTRPSSSAASGLAIGEHDAALHAAAPQQGVTANAEIGIGSSGVRGLVASRPLLANETVLLVPEDKLLSARLAGTHNVVQALILSSEGTDVEVGERPDLQLMAFLVACCGPALDSAGGATELLALHLPTLPRSYEEIPLHWADSVLERMLPPARVAEVRAQKKEAAALRQMIRSVAPLTLSAADRYWRSSGRPADPVTWAYCSVRSRAFGVMIDGERSMVMVPLVDMLNHAGPAQVNADWDFDATRRAFVVTSRRTVPRGAEVLVSYGNSKSNAHLLLHYGFTLPAAASDALLPLIYDPVRLVQEQLPGETDDNDAALRRAAFGAERLRRRLFFGAARCPAAEDAEASESSQRVVVRITGADQDAGALHALSLVRVATALPDELLKREALGPGTDTMPPAEKVVSRDAPLHPVGFVLAGEGCPPLSARSEKAATQALAGALESTLAEQPSLDDLEAAAREAGLPTFARDCATAVLRSEERALRFLLEACEAASAALAASSEEAPLAPAVLAASRGLAAQRLAEGSAVVDVRLIVTVLPGKGRGYVAAAPIAAGDRLLVERPLVFRERAEDGEAIGEQSDAAFKGEVVSRVIGSAACSSLLRPPEEYPLLTSTLEGVSDEDFSHAWAAAAANGFRHMDAQHGARLLLYSNLSIFNHACTPNACLDDKNAAVSTAVYAIRDVAEGEEVCICYLPDALATSNPTLRKAFIRHRFEFECDCPRCSGAACDADGRAVPSASLAADALLEALAPEADAAAAAAAQAAHKGLVLGKLDERRQLIGLELRQHDTYDDALRATDPFWNDHALPSLAPTHWQRHLVRHLRCEALLELPNRAVPAVMLIAEALAAESRLLPRGLLLRLKAYHALRVALNAVPTKLRAKLLERAEAAHGPLQLAWLEEVEGWLKRPGSVAQPPADGVLV